MRAMVLEHLAAIKTGSTPLRLADVSAPVPADDEVLLQVQACGVCHTELDEIEGRTAPATLPLIPGHQVVGRIAALGKRVDRWQQNERVGVAWIYRACGECSFCMTGRENLCPDFLATGRDRDGGYAQYMVAPAAFIHRIPDAFSDVEAAPMLCAGAIGYRSLALTNLSDGQTLGLTGFGASAHLVLKLAKYRFPKSRVFVFARSERERAFAKELGAVWAGDAEEPAPRPIDAMIDTTPAWTPVVAAMKNLAPGGRLVSNAIRKEDMDKSALMRIDYPAHLWLEKEIKSVANVTRRDVREFLQAAANMRLKPQIQQYALADANQALVDLKRGSTTGAKVLVVD